MLVGGSEVKGNELEQVSLSDVLKDTSMNNQNTTSQSFTKPLGSGFDALNGMLLSGVNNSVLTTAVVKNMKVVFEKHELEAKGFHIIPLDREANTTLAYSTIVVTKTYKGQDGKTYAPYFMLVLEGTGNKPMTAGQIKNEIESAIKLGKKPSIWMADLAVDKYLLKVVETAILNKLGSDLGTYSLDGLVVPTHHNITIEQLCEKLAIKAVDTLVSNEALVTGIKKDIVLTEAIRDNSVIKAEINLNTTGITYHNMLDKPISADAIVELVEVKNQTQALQTLNVPDSRFKLGQVSVKLEFIPEQVQKPVPGGTIVCMRLRPHVIITNVECSPTIGFLALMIRAGALITQQNTWLALASNNKNLGAMNILTNLESNASGFGEPYDFNRKDITTEQVQDIIRKMTEGLEPILSMDVDKFGPTTSLASILTQAAMGESTDRRASASSHFIKTLVTMTAGAFNANYPIDQIFTTSVGLPIGSYGSKTGERDVREVDNTFIMASTKDLNKVKNATLCKVAKNFSNTDPMTASVDFLASVVDEAEISGRTYRLTFNGNFIAELISKTAQCGLNLTFDPLIRNSSTLSLEMMSNIYGGAAVRSDMGGLNLNTGGVNQQFSIYNYGYGGRGY